MLQRISKAVEELLTTPRSALSRRAKLLVDAVRLARETARELRRGHCALRASALAYQTLISFVPIVAIAMAILATFKPLAGYKDRFIRFVVSYVVLGEAGQTEAIVRENVERFAENASAIGVIGIAALFIVAFFLMHTAETTFNQIWEVRHPRPLLRRISNFTSVLVLGPLCFAFSIYTTQTVSLTDPFFSKLLQYMLPFVLSSLAFALLYKWLPNTLVRWRPALIGGLIAGILWQAANVGFNSYVKRVAYFDIYGTIGAIPIFLFCLYIAWLIVLFGAGISFVVQNFSDLTQKTDRQRRGIRYHAYLAARAMLGAARNYAEGRIDVDLARELAIDLNAPEFCMREILADLASKGLLIQTGEGESAGYIPARPMGAISLGDVIEAAAGQSLDVPAEPADAAREALARVFERLREAKETALAGGTIEKLLAELPPRRREAAGEKPAQERRDR